MPVALLNHLMVALRAGIVLTVVIWILDIPGRLQIGLFTEQLLVTVLGMSLALTFLMFPLRMGETGEEAVVAKALFGQKDVAGPIDIVLAGLSIATCFYVAIRYPELVRELVARPLGGVMIATVIVLLVFEASRRVAGLALVLIVLALCAHALLGWMLPEQFASRPVA
ncbi:MAG: hypothetical protein HY659_11635, partial [Rhizobiales bacterium]|nr:hypothetical protein [Hyphomicrobiales bacterium]